MENEIYGNTSRVVELTYWMVDTPLDEQVHKEDDIPEVIDGIFRVISGRSIDLSDRANRVNSTSLRAMNELFQEERTDFETFDEVQIDSTVSNAIEFDEAEVTDFNKDLDNVTTEDTDLIKQALQNIMSHDRASAFVEAFVRQGLGHEGFSVDRAMREHVLAATTFAFVESICKKMKMSRDARLMFLEGALKNIQLDLTSKRRTQDIQGMLSRYSKHLEKPVGVKDNMLGRVGLRSGMRRQRNTEVDDGQS